MDDKERAVEMPDPFVKTASTTTASAVNNNEGVGVGASRRFPNARRHQGFCWSSLEKQASLKKKEEKEPQPPCTVASRAGAGKDRATLDWGLKSNEAHAASLAAHNASRCRAEPCGGS